MVARSELTRTQAGWRWDRLLQPCTIHIFASRYETLRHQAHKKQRRIFSLRGVVREAPEQVADKDTQQYV